jgi:DNA repair protein RadA/Sms
MEVDRVLGGGLVHGSVTLIGGEPGIGKSTLLTQIVLKRMSDQSENEKILYVSAEESPEQVALRIQRLLAEETSQQSTKTTSAKRTTKVLKETPSATLSFIATTNVDDLLSAIAQHKPTLVIVDSIQCLWTDDLTGAAGSVGQLRESSFRLIEIAKQQNVAMFFVGHVTKEGMIAGPKVLEHMVDTVLELQGDRTSPLRILRAIKNRFGPTDETGVFTMTERGLEEVSNPSSLFLEESTVGKPGSAIVPIVEGTRVLLVEVQALVVSTRLAVPRRVASGFPITRLNVLVAVLQKYARLALGEMDVYVNVIGGLRVQEPAADLAIAMAIWSSFSGTPLPADTVYAAEIGLLGELRTVSFLKKRSLEAERLGYPRLVSALTTKHINGLLQRK